MTQRFLPLLVAACLSAGAAAAQDAQVRAELLPGWRTASGTHMAAIRFTMAEGWKTYWRAPGDAGVPPQFDWRGSQNVAGVQIHWPQPEVFELAGMTTYGYSQSLVLPVEFIPTGTDPVRVEGTIEIGVCKDVCVPVTVAVSGALPDTGAPDAAIRAALAAGPEPVSAHATCAAAPLRDGLRLTLTVPLAKLPGDERAVIELADPSIWVSEATTTRQGQTLTAVADLVPANAQPFALDRSSVLVTVLGAGRAVELRGCTG